MGAVAFGAILFAVFLVVIAVMVWQETRRAPAGSPAVYVLDDAAAYVCERLPTEVAERLSTADVRSILEWGLLHKQAVAGGRSDARPVVGGEDSIAYIAGHASASDGSHYSPADIAAVLEVEARYLVAIGAVGPPVEGEATP